MWERVGADSQSAQERMARVKAPERSQSLITLSVSAAAAARLSSCWHDRLSDSSQEVLLYPELMWQEEATWSLVSSGWFPPAWFWT